MEDVNSDFVLVLRDSLSIPNGFILPNLAERLTQTDCLCLVPRYFDVNKASVPTHFIPFVEKTHFKVEQNNLVGDGLKTLYPYDFMGFYNRKKFIELGGFDYTIKTPYWQLLDFALRSWLWGEKIQLSTLFQFNYAYECPLEDHTINLDYLKYHLKNEAPKIKMGAGIIKKTAFWGFYNHSACGILEAKRMFDAARLWVKQNRYRFKMDLQTFIDEWNKNENK